MQRVLHRLRDGGHRRPRAARRARRPEAGAPPDALRDVRRRLPSRPRLLQVLARRRRRHGPVPPARRHRDLRHLGAPRAAVGDARAAGPRAGQLRLAGQRRRRGHAVHRVPDRAAGAWRWSATSTRTPSTSTPTTTAAPRSRRSCRRGSRTCWSTAPPASRSAWPPTSRRTTSREVADGALWALEHPDATREELLDALRRAHQGPRLPQRRADRRPRGHRAGLPHRPRLDHPARRRRDRRGQQGPHLPGHHRAALHGQPGQPRAEDRRARRLRQGAGHRRRARRLLLPHRPAAGRRTQARRRGPGGAEQPAQAHRAADQLLRQHAGAGRRRAAHADPRPVRLQLGDPPDRGHPAADPLPAAPRPSAAPTSARSGQGARHARRRDRADPAQARRRRRPRRA